MSFVGKVVNGKIILEGDDPLPEGARVKVEIEDPASEVDCHSIRDLLLKFSGTAADLPSDFAEHHDHYLHGTPKQ